MKKSSTQPTPAPYGACFLFAIAVLAILATGCGRDAAPCTSVQGRVDGVSVPVMEGDVLTGFQVDDAVVSGSLQGTASAAFTIADADADGTLRLTGAHTFWDEDGALLFRTADQGLTTAAGAVENNMMLVEGATGTLQTAGHVDLATGALQLAYTGAYCR